MVRDMNKTDVRSEMIAMRRRLSTDSVEKCSIIISNRVIEHPVFKKSDKILLYSAINNEVDTKNIFKYAIENNKKVYFPRVNSQNIEFYEVKSLDELKGGYMSILEPINLRNLYETNTTSCIIVPGVAFDKSLNRLGYGGGFYDRFLAKNNGIYRIAIGYSTQMVDKLPLEQFDVKMDTIIMENACYV